MAGAAAAACSMVTATAWITAAMRAALWIASADTSCFFSVFSCESTHLPQPLIAETAS